MDLFFVLSGFLISGLLFTEYKKRGAIDFKRFFIRRGLKIYSAFYTLILVSAVIGFALRNPASLANYLREIFFVQNYNYGMWPHTLSLAIEEHFYILLPVLLPAFLRARVQGAFDIGIPGCDKSFLMSTGTRTRAGQGHGCGLV